MKNPISKIVSFAALCQLINAQPALACIDFIDPEQPGINQTYWAIFIFLITAITFFVIRRKSRDSKVKTISLLVLLIVTGLILAVFIFFPSIPAVSFAC